MAGIHEAGLMLTCQASWGTFTLLVCISFQGHAFCIAAETGDWL